MAELEKLICPCCGGTIDRLTLRCEYCGTPFQIQDNTPVVRIETFHNPIRTLQVVKEVPREFIKNFGTEKVVQIAAAELAKSLADCISFDSMYDPATMSYRILSTVKVVEPLHKASDLYFI